MKKQAKNFSIFWKKKQRIFPFFGRKMRRILSLFDLFLTSHFHVNCNYSHTFITSNSPFTILVKYFSWLYTLYENPSPNCQFDILTDHIIKLKCEVLNFWGCCTSMVAPQELKNSIFANSQKLTKINSFLAFTKKW